jgi:hypothetical protein
MTDAEVRDLLGPPIAGQHVSQPYGRPDRWYWAISSVFGKGPTVEVQSLNGKVIAVIAWYDGAVAYSVVSTSSIAIVSEPLFAKLPSHADKRNR